MRNRHVVALIERISVPSSQVWWEKDFCEKRGWEEGEKEGKGNWEENG